jgi:PAS domain S-box-containing protein
MPSPRYEPQSKYLLEAELQATLNLIPAYTWYADSSGALTFVNERLSNYLGLPNDHPLRFGTATGAQWDSHLPLLHPDDHEETRRVWSTCLRTNSAGEVSFRVRNAEGGYRWFLSRVEPLRTSDGTLLYWLGVNLDIEERKHAEFYLAEGQRLAHMGSWAFNATGFDYWSSELFRIHGLDPSGKPPTLEEYLDLVHAEDRGFMKQAIKKMLVEHRGFDFTKRIVQPDGKIRSLHWVGVLRTHGETFVGFVGTGIDVTEQEQLTQELQHREAYLAEAQRLSHTGSFGWSVSSGQIFWSDETFRNFQCPKQTKPTLEFVLSRVRSEDRELVQQQIERASRDGEGFDFEHRLQLPDGSAKHVRVTAHPSRDSAGNLEFVGAVTDVSEQRHAEAVIREQEAELREVVDTIPAIVWSALPDGSNSYVNSRYAEYCGMPPEQIGGSGWQALAHPDDLERHNAKWLACVASGEPSEDEVRFRRADGQYRWHLQRGIPCEMRLATSSNGMASSPTSKIGSGRKTKSANKRQSSGRCWTSRLNLLGYTDPTANVSMSTAFHLTT